MTTALSVTCIYTYVLYIYIWFKPNLDPPSSFIVLSLGSNRCLFETNMLRRFKHHEQSFLAFFIICFPRFSFVMATWGLSKRTSRRIHCSWLFLSIFFPIPSCLCLFAWTGWSEHWFLLFLIRRVLQASILFIFTRLSDPSSGSLLLE